MSSLASVSDLGRRLADLLPGLLLAALFATVAWIASGALKPVVFIEPLVLGMVLGIFFTAVLGSRPVFRPGLDLAAKPLLEAAVVLLGFRLDFLRVGELGPAVLAGVVVFVPVIVLAAWVIGKRCGLPSRLALLIGVGSGICGSSAIAAIAPVIDADEHETALAISGLSVIGAAAVIAFSALAWHAGLGDTQYGVWAGLSLQAVPSAIAAAFARNEVAGEVGTVVKMARVALLAPMSMLLALLFHSRPGATAKTRRLAIPAYVICFIAAAAVNTLGWLPKQVSSSCASIGGLLMLTAMTALGVAVDLRSLKGKAGPALGFSVMLFLAIAVSAYAWCRWMV